MNISFETQAIQWHLPPLLIPIIKPPCALDPISTRNLTTSEFPNSYIPFYPKPSLFSAPSCPFRALQYLQLLLSILASAPSLSAKATSPITSTRSVTGPLRLMKVWILGQFQHLSRLLKVWRNRGWTLNAAHWCFFLFLSPTSPHNSLSLSSTTELAVWPWSSYEINVHKTLSTGLGMLYTPHKY